LLHTKHEVGIGINRAGHTGSYNTQNQRWDKVAAAKFIFAEIFKKVRDVEGFFAPDSPPFLL
jgi:hypothetical protein